MENTLPYIIYILFIIIYNIYTYIYTNREKRKVGKELIKIFQTESCVLTGRCIYFSTALF